MKYFAPQICIPKVWSGHSVLLAAMKGLVNDFHIHGVITVTPVDGWQQEACEEAQSPLSEHTRIFLTFTKIIRPRRKTTHGFAAATVQMSSPWNDKVVDGEQLLPKRSKRCDDRNGPPRTPTSTMFVAQVHIRRNVARHICLDVFGTRIFHAPACELASLATSW